MKYIKSYKLFESVVSIDEVMSNIYDILLELIDDEFKIENNDKIGSIVIVKTKNNPSDHIRFTLTENVLDVINRCCDYARSIGYECILCIDRKDGEYKFSLSSLDDFYGEDVYFIGLDLRRQTNEMNHYQETSELIKTLQDICIELGDEGVEYEIKPDNEIKVKMLSLKQRGLIERDEPFYMNIYPNSALTNKEKRSGFLELPEWFGEIIRRINDFIVSLGYHMEISVKSGASWFNMNTIDDLMDCKIMAQQIRLKFEKQ